MKKITHLKQVERSGVLPWLIMSEFGGILILDGEMKMFHFVREAGEKTCIGEKEEEPDCEGL